MTFRILQMYSSSIEFSRVSTLSLRPVEVGVIGMMESKIYVLTVGLK